MQLQEKSGVRLILTYLRSLEGGSEPRPLLNSPATPLFPIVSQVSSGRPYKSKQKAGALCLVHVSPQVKCRVLAQAWRLTSTKDEVSESQSCF